MATPRKLILDSLLIFLISNFLLSQTWAKTDTCPSVCSCRWKSGKKAVECRNSGLISVPSSIESDTQVLDLTGNNLQTLPRHSFKRLGLTNLQKIHLRHCKIGRIDPDALFQLTNLVELDLRDNLLTSVPSNAFMQTHSLRDLYLGGNRLHRINRDAFRYTENLVRLDLSLAGIINVADGAFNSLRLLEKIDLQGNQLSELPPSIVRSLEKVHSLQVHGNPWICDCRVLPLWRLLQERHVPHPQSPSCQAPHRISGVSFDRLTEYDLACPPTILPIARSVHGVAGENTSITCPVQGHPMPQVTWFMDDSRVINGSILGLGPQRVYIINEHSTDTKSRLIITGAQEGDSGMLRCVATNTAGQDSANFTLSVTMSAVEHSKLQSGHIAGISIALVIVALIVLVVGLLYIAKTRHGSPTPVKSSSRGTISCTASPSEPNPVQKPPRLTDISGSSGTIGSFGNPDVISEAERVRVNGHVPDGEAGDYTRVEGDSLYPSGLFLDSNPVESNQLNSAQDPGIHEHFNPGYMASDPPNPSFDPYAHSTPYNTVQKSQNVDPQTYGYPADYGLPIPEAGPDPVYSSRGDIYAQTKSQGPPIYSSRQDIYTPNPDSVKDSTQDLYRVNMSPVQNNVHSSQDIYGPPVYSSRQDIYTPNSSNYALYPPNNKDYAHVKGSQQGIYSPNGSQQALYTPNSSQQALYSPNSSQQALYKPNIENNLDNTLNTSHQSVFTPNTSHQSIYTPETNVTNSNLELYASQTIPNSETSSQDTYGTAATRPAVYGHRPQVYGSREELAEGTEGAESPRSTTGPPGERPWVPGSGAPPHTPGGVPVLPPLPNGVNRIKARDSPDEGYQEGTEV